MGGPFDEPVPPMGVAPKLKRAPTEEPAPEPQWSARDIWDPAGDPGPCRAAAAAYRRQSGVLLSLSYSLGEVGNPLPDFWKGEAADAHQTTQTDLLDELRQASEACSQVADKLDEVANKIQEFNDSIHELYIAVASVAAVSIVGAFFTFGASTAAGATATAGLIARAGRLASALRGTLALLRTAIATRSVTFTGFGAKWAKVIEGISFTPRLVPAGERAARFTKFYKDTGKVFAAGMPFSYVNKALSAPVGGKNIFNPGKWTYAADPNNWRVEDLTAGIVGAGLFGGVAGRMKGLGGPIAPRGTFVAGPAGIERLTRLQRTRWTFGPGMKRGLGMGLVAEPIGRYGIYDSDPNPSDAGQAAWNIGATSLGFGLGGRWMAQSGAPKNWRSEYGRNGVIFVPGTGLSLVGTTTKGTPIVPQQGSPLWGWLLKPDGSAPQPVLLRPPEAPGPLKPPPAKNP